MSHVLFARIHHKPRALTCAVDPGHPRLRRYSIIMGVSVVVLTIAWWVNPALGGILTLVASVVLASALAPGQIDIDRHRAGLDYRDTVGWYL